MKKSIVKKLTASLCLLSMFCCTQQYIANAANTSDTDWSYSVGGNSDDTRYTATRLKTNATKAYCQIKSFSENHEKNDYLLVTLVNSNKNKFSRDWERSINKTGKYSITNYAYEDNGQCYVRLRFRSNAYRWTYTWGANGVWSPDSTRVYS